MATKRIGISRDLVIHPGETIADVLDERGISQAELAARTGFTPAFISSVISGKKDISAKLAMALEYALDIPKSFWLNLQANYDAELLDLNEAESVTDEERQIRDELKEVVSFLRKKGKMPERESVENSIISLRKALQVSSLSNLSQVAAVGAFRLSKKTKINPYILGAWIRCCQMKEDDQIVTTQFDISNVENLIQRLKDIMLGDPHGIQRGLAETLAEFGINFHLVHNFRGAPVQGFISRRDKAQYHLYLTLRGSYADIFWFSLFHEIGHIANGDINGKAVNFVDDGTDEDKEKRADKFASEHIIRETDFDRFIQQGDFSINAIRTFAQENKVRPYMVIGRLQKQKIIGYNQFTTYKSRYKWAVKG
jgi:HTH-type transcriptional regulator/antitoxin HigA